jgi:hypothetical protein
LGSTFKQPEAKHCNLDQGQIENKCKFQTQGGCKLRSTGLEDFLVLYELHEVHEFDGFFHLQRDLQLIAEAKRGFIEALHRQNCLLWVVPEHFPH